MLVKICVLCSCIYTGCANKTNYPFGKFIISVIIIDFVTKSIVYTEED